MSTEPGARISLEAFHRHFLITHLKGEARSLLNELERRARASGEPFSNLLAELVGACYPKQTAFRDDNWFAKEVPLDRCYVAQTGFRACRVPKGQRFVDFLDTRIKEIERGYFPLSNPLRRFHVRHRHQP